MGKKAETTKATIVAKAIALFRARSYDKVTIQDICEAAEITRGTFYYHFKTKEEVLFGFYEAPEEIALQHMPSMFAADNGWDRLWLSYLPFLEYSQAAGGEVLAQCMRANLAENRGTFDPRKPVSEISTQLIKKGQAEGALRNPADPEALNFIAIQILIVYDFQWALHKESFEKIGAMRGALEVLFDVEPSLRKGTDPKVL